MGDSREPGEQVVYKWDEVVKHNTPEDLWLVIEDGVYDVTKFQHRHPGLPLVMQDMAGQDATRVFQYYHLDQAKVRKFMKTVEIGQIECRYAPADKPERTAMEKDIDELRKTCHKLNLFKASVNYHVSVFLGIMLLNVLGYYILKWYGTGWFVFLTSVLLFGMGQVQAGFASHDFGHRGVTRSPLIDDMIQKFYIGLCLGLSGGFWNFYHARHHSKPNILDKDPTIKINEHIFVLGKLKAEELGKEKKKSGSFAFPFHFQHLYWFILGVPLYVPVLFQLASFKFCLKFKRNVDIALMLVHFAVYYAIMVPLIGWGNAMLHYCLVRQVMTHSFVWTSLSNHLLLEAEYDPPEGSAWLYGQMMQTVNFSTDRLTTLYTGGMNYQIEHHIFPDMSRDKHPFLAPLLKELCEKHNVPYRTWPLLECYIKVYKYLKLSGATFYEIYHKTLAGE